MDKCLFNPKNLLNRLKERLVVAVSCCLCLFGSRELSVVEVL